MSSTKKKLQVMSMVSVNIGCMISCRKPKIPRKFRSITKPKDQSSSSSSLSSSSSSSSRERPRAIHGGSGKLGSVAIEIESEDPYLDFLDSMAGMILENEIYSKHDLLHLLHIFLELNSPSIHSLILKAFADIWNSLFSVATCKSVQF